MATRAPAANRAAAAPARKTAKTKAPTQYIFEWEGKDRKGKTFTGEQRAESAAEAREIIEREKPGIEGAARAVSGGRQVTVTLGRENYPTRQYGGFSLPAGSYTSLRVVLGEGKGHNWWCVVFPPLCPPPPRRRPPWRPCRRGM